MILRYDNNLAETLNLEGKRFGSFTDKFIDLLLEHNLIDTTFGEEVFYNECVFECINPSAKVEELINIIKEAGIEEITSAKFHALMCAEVLGDGDCPFCGSDDYRVISQDFHCTFGDGYNSEYEYDGEEIRECRTCGNKYSV